MARERRTSDSSPLVRPVKRITLTENNPRKKIIIIIIALVIALIAFGFALNGLLNGSTRWNTMTADSASGITCESQVSLQYNLTGVSTPDRKRLSLVYSKATEDAYAVFNPSQHFDSLDGNLFDISKNAGKKIKIDAGLYKALELSEKYNNRYIYLAPLYQVYDDLFMCEDDSSAAYCDPQKDKDIKEYFEKVISFVSKPENIQLELFGDNTVRLNISKEYLDFAKENDITSFLDFYQMRNAFVIDYIADILIKEKLTNGYLCSVDGFNRNLFDGGESFSLNLFHRDNDTVAAVGIMEYDYPLSIVSLKNYPVDTDNLDDRYYIWDDGKITNAYISTENGLCQTCISELYAVSKEKGCSEIVLSIAPYYISEKFDRDAVTKLTKHGIVCIWWENDGFVQSEKDAVVINK